MADPLELADGMVKQLLTLATASLGGIVAIFDDGTKPGVQLTGRSPCLIISLVLLALSVTCGVLVLGGLIGQSARTDGATPNIYHTPIRVFTISQMFCYALGILFVVADVAIRG